MGVSLTRTQGTPTSRKKFTFSFWYKKTTVRDYGASTSDGCFFNSAYSNDNRLTFMINQENSPYDQVRLVGRNGASSVLDLRTNAQLRDPSAWYHIVAKVDTTQSTNTDRAKLYINGTEQTLDTSSYPNQDVELNIQYTPYLLSYSGSGNYVEGLITHYHYTDGYAYDASTFGETDSTSGIWKPKTAPSVTYGTNGFFLKFENSGAMGTDSSGQSNTFTVSGTLTQNVDTPSNNFATINPNQNNIANLSNGNLTATTSNYQWGMSTLAVNSGKWYVEMKVTHGCMVMGIQDIGKANVRLAVNGTFWTSGSQSYHLDGFSKFTHDSYGDISSDSSAYPSYGNGDIVMMALDLDNNKLAYGKNGTWYNSTNPGSGTTNMVSIDAPSSNENGNYGIVFGDTCSANDGTFNVNFGQGFFGTTAVASANADANGHGAMEYAVPSGYYTLNTKNIKEFG